MSVVKLTTQKCLDCGVYKDDDNYDALCVPCEYKSNGRYRKCLGCKTSVAANLTACTACIREYPLKRNIVDLEQRLRRLEAIVLEQNSPSK